MSCVVVPWLLLAADADLRTVGLGAAAQLLAYLLAGPLGVALADGRHAVRVGVAADLLSALALAGVAYFALPGRWPPHRAWPARPRRPGWSRSPPRCGR
jgi:hypothetical protein